MRFRRARARARPGARLLHTRLTSHDVAAKLSEGAGSEIRYFTVTPGQFRAGALASGLPDWLASALERLNETFVSGHAAEVTDDVRRVARREQTTIDRFARDHARAFKSSRQ